MKNCLGHRVHTLMPPEEAPETELVAESKPAPARKFDDISVLACGVLLFSASTLLYVLVPAFGFDVESSVAGQVLGGSDTDLIATVYGVFGPLVDALD